MNSAIQRMVNAGRSRTVTWKQSKLQRNALNTTIDGRLEDEVRK